jgi:hypothetical protein
MTTSVAWQRLLIGNDNMHVLFSFGGWLDDGQVCSTAFPSNPEHFCCTESGD